MRRLEDARLVTGAGRYTDDVSLLGQVYAAFVRSPHAHARIRAIDARPALAVPGVLDALGEFGVEHIELPATPERIWRAIRAAR